MGSLSYFEALAMSQALSATPGMACPAHRVAEFRQRDLVRRAPEDMSYGMCVGFSIAWLIRHRYYKAQAAQARLEYLRLGGAAAAERDQRAYLAARTQQDGVQITGQSGAINAGFAAGGSTARIVATQFIRLDSESLNDEMDEVFVHTSGIHNYYLLVLSFGATRLNIDADNHVIAAYHSNGKFRGWGSHLYVFEPNFGEFKLSGSEVKGFFRQLVAAYAGYVNKDGVVSKKTMRMITVHKVHVA
jgi:hypothetical protein